MDLMRMSEREYLAEVAKRPAMFIGRTTLTGLEGYLFGYDAHAHRHGAITGGTASPPLALGDEWEHWDLPADQEQQVIAVLFDLLDEFLAERETMGVSTR